MSNMQHLVKWELRPARVTQRLRDLLLFYGLPGDIRLGPSTIAVTQMSKIQKQVKERKQPVLQLGSSHMCSGQERFCILKI